MIRLIALAVLAALSSPLHAGAEDITTLKGKTYTGVSVERVDPDGITIKHSAGFGKLFFSELPQETRDQYGYDPKKHRQYYNAQQKQAAKARLLRLVEATAIEAKAKFRQVLDDGFLAYITEYYNHLHERGNGPSRRQLNHVQPIKRRVSDTPLWFTRSGCPS